MPCEVPGPITMARFSTSPRQQCLKRSLDFPAWAPSVSSIRDQEKIEPRADISGDLQIDLHNGTRAFRCATGV
jgi:hypothetical protein